MTKHTIKKIAVASASAALLTLPFVVGAAGLDVGFSYTTSIGLGTADVRTTIGGLIKAFMGLLGLVAVCIILLGGFKWMTSQGSEEKVDEAKKLIVSGVIGLVIIIAAYGIANFAINAIVNQS